MKRLLAFLVVPIFYFYGPNAVGYNQIIATDMNDPAIQMGDKMACSYLSQYGDHRLLDGTLYMKEPFFLTVNTPLFKDVPLPIDMPGIEFCLVAPGKR